MLGLDPSIACRTAIAHESNTDSVPTDPRVKPEDDDTEAARPRVNRFDGWHNTVPEPAYQPTYQRQRQEPLTDAVLPPAVTTPAIAAPADTYDKKKWQTLVRYDDDLRAASGKVRIFGSIWEDDLAEEYLKINDKTYLPRIVERIVGDATKGV